MAKLKPEQADTRGHHQRKAGHACCMRPSDHRVAQPIRPRKGKPEGRADHADSRTDEQR